MCSFLISPMHLAGAPMSLPLQNSAQITPKLLVPSSVTSHRPLVLKSFLLGAVFSLLSNHAVPTVGSAFRLVPKHSLHSPGRPRVIAMVRGTIKVTSRTRLVGCGTIPICEYT